MGCDAAATMAPRLRHLWLALRALPMLIVSPPRRALFREMQTFIRALPAALQAPLPQALARLTPATPVRRRQFEPRRREEKPKNPLRSWRLRGESQVLSVDSPAHREEASGVSADFVGVDFVGADFIRDLSDLTALLDRRSSLGLCLRRSLVRFHYLRRAGLPVTLKFGAKFVAGKPDREITGHAWLTLDDAPYHEADENWKGFVVMLSFPQN